MTIYRSDLRMTLQKTGHRADPEQWLVGFQCLNYGRNHYQIGLFIDGNPKSRQILRVF
jgi:hypothetical protein